MAGTGIPFWVDAGRSKPAPTGSRSKQLRAIVAFVAAPAADGDGVPCPTGFEWIVLDVVKEQLGA